VPPLTDRKNHCAPAASPLPLAVAGVAADDEAAAAAAVPLVAGRLAVAVAPLATKPWGVSLSWLKSMPY
jgi:hypothetical protein